MVQAYSRRGPGALRVTSTRPMLGSCSNLAFMVEAAALYSMGSVVCRRNVKVKVPPSSTPLREAQSTQWRTSAAVSAPSV